MPRPSSSQHGFDVSPAQSLAVRVRVIVPIPLNARRATARATRLPRTTGIASTSGSDWVMSGALAFVSLAAKGIPRASVMIWCLLPNFLRSVGLGPVASPPEGASTWSYRPSALDQSMRSASRNSLSRTSCRRCQTPARCQRRKQERQVLPHPQPSSAGRSSQSRPVFRTKTMRSEYSGAGGDGGRENEHAEAWPMAARAQFAPRARR